MAQAIVTIRSINFSLLLQVGTEFDLMLASLYPFGILGVMAVMQSSMSGESRKAFYVHLMSGLPYYYTSFGDIVRCVFGGDEIAARQALAIGQEILELAPQHFPELRRIGL
jgi:hypothetical protein